MQNKDDFYMKLCELIATQTKCLSRQVGAIAVKEGRVLATGYNGPPMKYPHCGREDDNGKIWCPRKFSGLPSGVGLENCPSEHAERNVVNNAALNGVSLKGSTMYVSSEAPCRECAKAIVNSGIAEVVMIKVEPYPEPGLTGIDIFARCNTKIRLVNR
jgi:dCMP deaminase